ncbi:hypothetical protein [Streptomyces sp. NPDC002952]|uniref:DUF7574 domain-containing protein n=1 Tax=Streptomyces sp. NPDC002952 TaxID=3364673 RepID=UPI0036A3804F
MADYDMNIYYSPEKHGLTVLGEIDTADSYEFCMLVVWERVEDGALFWDTDSGCSCPSPFEDADSVAQLTRIDDASEFASEARKWLRESSYSGVMADDRDALERLIRKVQRHMRKAVAV